MAKFIDFDSIIKTDWTKPSVQKNPLWIVAALGAVLALVSVFVKWITLSTSVKVMGNEVISSNLSSAPFDNTEAIFIVVGLVLALYGLLYRQWGVATLAGLVIFGFSCSYMVDAISETATIVNEGETFTLKELSDNLKAGVEGLRMTYGDNAVTHFTEIGGYGFMYAVVGGLLTTVCSFLLYRKNK